MTTEPVLVEVRGALGVATLNRPDERNPLDPVMASALVDALESLFADDAVRSVAITGAGEAFCAGGDLRQMARFRELPVEDAYAWPAAIVELHQLMLRAPKPVVAAVDGPAYAGGMGLAGMCDIVLATSRSTFAMPEVKLGMFPMIIIAHLARSVPRKALLEMMLTGEPIDAAEAHRLGFVNHTYADRAELATAVDNYAVLFTRISPHAVRLGRRAFTLLADLPAGQALDAASFFNLPFFLGTDLAEGAEAFFERRPPSWQSSTAGRLR
ncbi:MAG: enoyl-CoA hydratase-related protein [Candidatus Nanopelagicales bacterium]